MASSMRFDATDCSSSAELVFDWLKSNGRGPSYAVYSLKGAAMAREVDREFVKEYGYHGTMDQIRSEDANNISTADVFGVAITSVEFCDKKLDFELVTRILVTDWEKTWVAAIKQDGLSQKVVDRPFIKKEQMQ